MAYTARVRLPGSLGQLLRSEMEIAISEANLGNSDSLIAKRYFLERIPQMDIAAELDIERSTISRRLPFIIERIEKTAQRLNLT
jgi:DNA-directed RNA polymerase specialized sigma subunit